MLQFKLWENLKLNLWQNSKTFWHHDNRYDVLWAAFYNSCVVLVSVRVCRYLLKCVVWIRYCVVYSVDFFFFFFTICFLLLFLILKKLDKVMGSSRWRVCYQRGLSSLVFRCASISSSDDCDWNTDWNFTVIYHLRCHHWDWDIRQSLKMECHSKLNVS